MPSYTYPPSAATLDGTLTVAQVHYLLKNPALLARRVRILALNKYVADFLLPGRYVAQGGAIMYPNGESIFSNDDPEAVGVGGEYPLTTIDAGTLALAKTVKWGRDVEIYDESISRMLLNPVTRAIDKLVASNVKYIDSVALGVIASKITRTFTGASWAALTTGDQIVEDVLGAIAATEELEDGFTIDTVVLKPTQYAKVRARLSAADLLPREGDNPIETSGNGTFNYLGLTWVASMHSPTTDPLLLDRQQLGGMADENIESPGYATGPGGVGVEVASWRLGGEGNRDGWRVRARRVTVPVVLEPNAGVKITGHGI